MAAIFISRSDRKERLSVIEECGLEMEKRYEADKASRKGGSKRYLGTRRRGKDEKASGALAKGSLHLASAIGYGPKRKDLFEH